MPKESRDKIDEALRDNVLIARAISLESKKKYSRYDKEFDILFERKHIDPTGRRPGLRCCSCSLLVEDLPMFLFDEVGLLFDADQSSIFLRSTQDAFTTPGPMGWGSISTLGESGRPTSLISNNNQLSKEMRQLYKDLQSGNIQSAYLENPPVDGILAHNEMKASLMYEGLLGLFCQKFSESTTPRMQKEKKEKYDLPDSHFHFEDKLKLSRVYKLKKHLQKHYSIDLPIILWDPETGKIEHWIPTPATLAELKATDASHKQYQKFLKILATSSDIDSLTDFLTTRDNLQEQLNRRNITDGTTPLIMIIRKKPVLSQVLIEQGADVNLCDFSDNTPLHIALITGEDEIAHLLLDKGVNVNTVNDSSQTPLFLAAQQGKIDLVVALLERGAKKTLSTKANLFGGITALDIALQNGHIQIVKILLDITPPTDLSAAECLERVKKNHSWSREEIVSGLQAILQLNSFPDEIGDAIILKTDGAWEIGLKDKNEADLLKAKLQTSQPTLEYGAYYLSLTIDQTDTLKTMLAQNIFDTTPSLKSPAVSLEPGQLGFFGGPPTEPTTTTTTTTTSAPIETPQDKFGG